VFLALRPVRLIGSGGVGAGPVTIEPGALIADHGKVTGPLNATGAAGLSLCGPTSVDRATGLVAGRRTRWWSRLL